MLISTVIDNYNQGQFLADAIESALNQEGPCEVIVVDDGSTDDSRAVLDRYRSRVQVIEKTNGGQASALSAGVAASRGDAVCLLDADDVFEPGKVARIRQAFSDAPQAQWCFHRYFFCGPDLAPLPNPPLAARKPTPLKTDYRADIERGWLPYLPTGICGMAFRRSLVDQLFPMPSAPGIAVSDNYLKFLALSLAPGVFLSDCLARQRLHDANRYTGSGARRVQRAQIGTCTAYHLARANPRTLKFCRRMFLTTASQLPSSRIPPEVSALRDQFVAAHLNPLDRFMFSALRLVELPRRLLSR